MKPKIVVTDVVLYTDGACSGNPGPGGWGARLIHNASGTIKDFSGASPETTNNRMELTAVIEGLKALNRPCSVEVRSDSKYIVDAFLKNWIDGWQKRNWKKSNKKPVENQDLWQELLTAMEPHEVTWTHVKGHAGEEHNEACDRLAVAACQELMQSL